ncbi:MAG: gliding motility-associated C-terminal domain-containing protein, partial [Endomicrobiia bacterium]
EFWEAHTYNLYYGKVGTQGQSVITGITSTYYILNFSPEIENTNLWWKIEAIDTKTPEPNKKFSSQTWYIFVSSTNDPPEWPSDILSYISPANSSKVYTRTPEFIWPSAKDPDELAGDRILSYTLRYSTVPDLSSAVKEISGLSGTSYKLSSSKKLLQNTTYYWQVRAYDSNGLWTPTPIYSFYIPVILRLKPPEYFVRRELQDSGKKFYIEWTRVTEYEDGTPANYYDINTDSEKLDIKGYNIYRSDKPNGEYLLVGFAPLYNESWTDILDGNKTYYYLVRAVSLTGIESDISPVVSSSPEGQIIFMSQKKDAYVSISDYLNNVLRTGKKKISVEKELNECEIKVLNAETDTEIKNYKFPEPVILSFVYSSSDRSSTMAGNSKRTPSIFWHNGVEYIKLGGTIDSSDERVYVYITNTGKYKLQNISDKDFSFDIYPRKIFTPNGDGINDEIKFSFINNTGEQVSGEIYDLSGAFVKKMELKSDQGDYLVWDGKNDSGENARKGIYIYQIKVGSKVYTGTIIVAR